MYQVQVPLGNLPVNLVLIGNREQASVAFVRFQSGTVFDQSDDVSAGFFDENFLLFRNGTNESFEYNTAYDYKNIPAMLQWLKQQNLQEPDLVVFG